MTDVHEDKCVSLSDVTSLLNYRFLKPITVQITKQSYFIVFYSVYSALLEEYTE